MDFEASDPCDPLCYIRCRCDIQKTNTLVEQLRLRVTNRRSEHVHNHVGKLVLTHRPLTHTLESNSNQLAPPSSDVATFNTTSALDLLFSLSLSPAFPYALFPPSLKVTLSTSFAETSGLVRISLCAPGHWISDLGHTRSLRLRLHSFTPSESRPQYLLPPHCTVTLGQSWQLASSSLL